MGKLCSKLGLKPWTACLQLVVFLFYVLVQRRVVGGKEGNQPSLIQEAPPLSWCNAECRFEKLNLRPSLGVAPGYGWRSSTASLGVTPSDGCRSSTSARFFGAAPNSGSRSSTSARLLVQRRATVGEAQPPSMYWFHAE